MRFLIVGFGSIGRRHFRNLLALGQQDIILLRSNKSTLETDEIRDFPVETNLHKALAYKPDAVILANPTALHLDAAIPAAAAGCHLFFEKPISDSLNRMEQLLSAINKGGGKTFVGFQFRYHPGLIKVRELIQSKEIGRTISARAHWGEYLPGWHPWEDYRKSYSARKDLGGGVILTLSHPLDYMRWIFGEVSELWSINEQVPSLEIETEAVAEIAMRYKTGILGSLHLNYIQRPPRHTLEVVTEIGTIRWDNEDGAVNWFDVSKNQWNTCELPTSFERNDLFLAEMKDFLSYIGGNKGSVCTLEDGIVVQELVEAAYQSNQYRKMIKF